MRIITGDETGVLKDAWLEANEATLLGNILNQDRTRGVAAMCWGLSHCSSTKRRMLCARKSGVVETWECRRSADGGKSGPWSIVTLARDLPSAPVSIVSLPSVAAHVTFCCAGEICLTNTTGGVAGNLAQWRAPSSLNLKAEITSSALLTSSSLSAPSAVAHNDEVSSFTKRRKMATEEQKIEKGRCGSSGSNSGLSANVVKGRNWREAPAQVAAIASTRTSCGCVDASGAVAGVGGMEHDAAIVDVETGKVRWQARNVQHGEQQINRNSLECNVHLRYVVCFHCRRLFANSTRTDCHAKPVWRTRPCSESSALQHNLRTVELARFRQLTIKTTWNFACPSG